MLLMLICFPRLLQVLQYFPKCRSKGKFFSVVDIELSSFHYLLSSVCVFAQHCKGVTYFKFEFRYTLLPFVPFSSAGKSKQETQINLFREMTEGVKSEIGR